MEKKMLIMNVLDILRKYSDADHTLSLRDIGNILEREYRMKADRKAISRNITELEQMGYEIMYRETKRMSPVMDPKTKKPVIDPKTGKPQMDESNIRSDFYLIRDLTDGELRLLIDSLLFSGHIAHSDLEDLVRKLERLSSVYFRSRIGHISRMPDSTTDNRELFYNIEQLDEAITKKRKVSFRYTEYGTDKRIRMRRRSDGTVRDYIINPYQMAAREGNYYLICANDKYNKVVNYRVDRIRDLKILDESVKPFEELEGSGGRALDLAAYMKEHVYMYSSDTTRVKFRITRYMISDVIDMFGKDVIFSDETESEVTVSVYTNEMSMARFAKSYAPDVTVLEPKSLADYVRDQLARAVEKYKKPGERQVPPSTGIT